MKMVKYRLAAVALKGLSTSSATRSLYRVLGNYVGGKKRTRAMPAYYLERVQDNLSLCRSYVPLGAGDTILELGTGWVHWEALTLRLFYEFQAVLYDVWDNRQFDAMLNWLGQLDDRLADSSFLPESDKDRARWLIAKIRSCSDFDSVYRLLGFRYVLDPEGIMRTLPQDFFRLAISRGVMEHIPAETAPSFVANMAKVLGSGGVAIHGINISDHLQHYDTTAHPKQYLEYSNVAWRRLYENQVQYINRIQASEWIRLFREHGFELIDERREECSLGTLQVHPDFHLAPGDACCTTLSLTVRLPSHL